MAKKIYIAKMEHEVFGPFNERGLKPLIATSYGESVAYTTREAAETAIVDMLNLHEQLYTAWIGRKPDSRIDKLDAKRDAEAYIAYNVNEDDVRKIGQCYPDITPGGAIEVVASIEELPLCE